MALFDFGKQKGKVTTAARQRVAQKPVGGPSAAASSAGDAKKSASAGIRGSSGTSSVLVRPRITEKASFAMERGAYVFDVVPHATKTMVREAVERHFKVRPRKVNIVTIPRKSVQSRFRGVRGTTAGGKKAYVYLKSGDTIDTAV